jgi:hypothetical protein
VFYRRKIILTLLQLFDSQLDKIRLQKLLFLFTQRQAKPEYDFIPYRFGCFSYSANADMTTMVNKGLLGEDDKRFEKLDKIDYGKQLKSVDLQLLNEIKASYGKMSAKALMKYTYLNYPFYAVNSIAADNILTANELERVYEARPKASEKRCKTISRCS